MYKKMWTKNLPASPGAYAPGDDKEICERAYEHYGVDAVTIPTTPP